MSNGQDAGCYMINPETSSVDQVLSPGCWLGCYLAIIWLLAWLLLAVGLVVIWLLFGCWLGRCSCRSQGAAAAEYVGKISVFWSDACEGAAGWLYCARATHHGTLSAGRACSWLVGAGWLDGAEVGWLVLRLAGAEIGWC